MNREYKEAPQEKFGDTARIPDSDIKGWMEALHEMGLPTEEMNKILANLNDTYKKGLGEDYVRMEVEKIAKDSKENGIILTQYQRENLAKMMRENLEKEQ